MPCSFYTRPIGSVLCYGSGSKGIVEDCHFDDQKNECYIVMNVSSGARETVPWMEIDHVTQAKRDVSNGKR